MPAAAPARSDRLGQAVALMLTYVAMIVYVNACGKVMGERFHPFEVTLFRHGTAFLFVTLAFLPRHGPRVFVPKRPWLQIPRGLCGICSSLCYFAGLTAMSLADAAAISFTTPLIVAALSGPVLREPVGIARWAAIGVGFAGTLLIVRPGGGGIADWAGLLLFGSAVCSAGYQLLTRMVAGHDRAETTNIWSGLVGSCVMLCLLPIYWTAPGRWEDWALFLSMGAVGGFAHYLLTKAFERGPAAVLSPFNYFQLLGATLTGWVLYSALPDGWTWAGASAIVAAGLAVARTERARRAGNGGRGA